MGAVIKLRLTPVTIVETCDEVIGAGFADMLTAIVARLPDWSPVDLRVPRVHLVGIAILTAEDRANVQATATHDAALPWQHPSAAVLCAPRLVIVIHTLLERVIQLLNPLAGAHAPRKRDLLKVTKATTRENPSGDVADPLTVINVKLA